MLGKGTEEEGMIADRATRRKILKLVAKIKTYYKPDKIILFGSYAYGKPTTDSDIDLLIIKDTRARKPNRWVTLKRLAYDPKRGIPFSPLVYTPAELKKRLSLGDDFIKEIIERGELLYEKK
ncbi:MAG: nucleotidyltransferase domain-containing protein [Candidatus Thermoplasmatota archaeon]